MLASTVLTVPWPLAVTSTVSDVLPTGSLAFLVSTTPTPSSTLEIVTTRKLSWEKVIRYVAGRIWRNLYTPESFVVVVAEKPVAGLVSVTWAPTTRAPESSVTTPVTPEVACAESNEGRPQRSAKTTGVITRNRKAGREAMR